MQKIKKIPFLKSRDKFVYLTGCSHDLNVIQNFFFVTLCLRQRTLLGKQLSPKSHEMSNTSWTISWNFTFLFQQPWNASVEPFSNFTKRFALMWHKAE